MAATSLAPLIARVRDLAQSGEAADQQVAVRLAAVAAEQHPDQWVTWHVLARAALMASDYGVAEAAYRRTIQLRPTDTDALNGLAVVLTRTGRPAEALTFAERAIASDLRSAAAHVTRGDIRRDLHRYEEAAADYAQALWLKPNWPEAVYNSAFQKFAVGDYAKGWAAYARRWDTNEFPPEQDIFRLKPDMARHGPRWGGAPLPPDATLLVWAEQGHGDTLWGLRYVEALLARWPEVAVVLQVQDALVRLVAHHYADRPQVTVIARNAPVPRWTLQCPLLNLPTALGLFVPQSAPQARFTAPTPWPRPEGRRRVGLVWGGSLTHANDPRRSIGLGDLAPLFRQAGIDWISLQVGPRAGEAQLLVEAGLVIDPTAALTDFAETANLVAGLDLVIGVDTANLHLASGLGVPSWWLIGEAPDWRYACVGDNPAHNVWYPASRLYRKPVGDAWDATIQQVATALAAWAG